MSEGKSYTILDIAKMANVSRGTVDRVIHNRGTVSQSSYEKVKKVLDQIDYKPNLIAQSLKKKGQLLEIAALIPDPKHDVFWEMPTAGIQEVHEQFSALGIKVDIHYFDSRNPESFRQVTEVFCQKVYNGILVVPFFYHESLEAFEKIDQCDTPFITFNTFIPEAKAISHVGQDLVQSGRVAAELMMKIVPEKCTLLIVHIDEDLTNSMHMQDKETGFKQYFLGSDVTVKVLRIQPDEDPELMVTNRINAESDVQGVYVTTSKVHQIANCVVRTNRKIKLIGYDLIDENIKQLQSGTVDFLIFQNPKYQANLGASYLIDALVFKKEIPKISYLPIEIITKENYRNYLER